jgi:hypothetical protein
VGERPRASFPTVMGLDHWTPDGVINLLNSGRSKNGVQEEEKRYRTCIVLVALVQ